MNDYYELTIKLASPSEDAYDYLAALLAEVGYESFVPEDDKLLAYVPARLYDEKAVQDIMSDFAFGKADEVVAVKVEGRDWNEEWEKNYFQPIVIAGECVVHSSFHTDVPEAGYDIVIDPKMAFGTGHHATTTLMLTRLLKADLQGKSLIDMGTGTGILAILAAMRGAQPVTGIEIDEFAWLNARDNVKLNGHDEIVLLNGDASALSDVKPADYFLANINRNVITADIDCYVEALRPGGIMWLSGFYEEDIPVIKQAAEAAGLEYQDVLVASEGDKWACVSFRK